MITNSRYRLRCHHCGMDRGILNRVVECLLLIVQTSGSKPVNYTVKASIEGKIIGSEKFTIVR